MKHNSLVPILMAAALVDVPHAKTYSTGASAAKPHDLERMQKAAEKRARKAARKHNP